MKKEFTNSPSTVIPNNYIHPKLTNHTKGIVAMYCKKVVTITGNQRKYQPKKILFYTPAWKKLTLEIHILQINESSGKASTDSHLA